MKKLSAVSVGLALITTVLSSCTKDECASAVFDASFYTSNPQGVYTLYIDNVEKGTLHYFATAPQCGQTFDEASSPLKLRLPSGTYALTARNPQGQIVSAGKITICKYSGGTSGGIGGINMFSTESCVTVGLFE